MKATPVFINGKDYPVKYGFAALRSFTDVTNMSLGGLSNLGSDMTISHAIALVWAGMKDGARVMKQDFTMSLDDVADLLDEDEEAIQKVLKVFEMSMSKPNMKKTKKK